MGILVILAEIGLPVLVILNRWYAATAAVLLAGFCFASGLIWHGMPSDAASMGAMADQLLMIKNFAWGGGLLAIAALANRD